MTNILKALVNLSQNFTTDIVAHYKSSNRINSTGEALEYYIKDLFCGSTHITNIQQKHEIYGEYFSYLGNQNNPPDIMIRGGDAIEVKKIEGVNSGIALNSSYPKNRLHANSPMITQACRTSEDWQEKDIIYTIGVVRENKLRSLWFVYGDCYAAEDNVYEKIKNKISLGITELSDVEFAETKELGRVNKVDPLGITYMRIRGMWHIQNPIKVFEYISDRKTNSKFEVNALMLKDKYLSFPEKDRTLLEGLGGRSLSVKDVRIKSPNNPVHMLDAKLINIIK